MATRLRFYAALLTLSYLVLCSASAQAQSGAVQSAPASPYKVLRSVSGAAGREDGGRYLMEDPKSVFVAGKDQKVIVYFEWEGPLGQHHFEGLWKSPEGKIVLISDFRYEAKGPRYSGYWTMLLSDGMPSGEWNLEARIDGEPAGSHSFVITGSASAASSGPKLLTSGELYQKALESTVTVEKLDADGTLLARGSGFWVGEGRLMTAFSMIDGATNVRIVSRDGSQLTTNEALAWNRWQDWTLLKVAGGGKSWLKRGAADPLKVGDRCVFLEIGAAGAKLADGSISGKNTFPKAGERLLIASGVTPLSFGGPLLDEYGNYAGVLGGSILPGGEPVPILRLLSDTQGSVSTDWDTTGLAVPQTLIGELPLNAATTHFADMANRGEFLPPVAKSKSILTATFTTNMEKLGPGVYPRDYKQVLSHKDKKAAFYVNWQNSNKEKFSCVLQLFNADNKMLTESKSREVSLGPGKEVFTTWEIPVTAMPAGIYRVDLVVAGKPGLREFFRVAD